MRRTAGRYDTRNAIATTVPQTTGGAPVNESSVERDDSREAPENIETVGLECLESCEGARDALRDRSHDDRDGEEDDGEHDPHRQTARDGPKVNEFVARPVDRHREEQHEAD